MSFLTKILFKQFIFGSFRAKMWVQIRSKMAKKMLFPYQPPYYHPPVSLKTKFLIVLVKLKDELTDLHKILGTEVHFLLKLMASYCKKEAMASLGFIGPP